MIQPIKMFFSIIIPVYKNWESLKRCLAAINNSIFRNFEIIIVDDASPAGDTIFLENAGQHLIRHKTNLGPSAARNTGAKEARGEKLIFLDSDVEIFPNTLTKIEKFFHCHPDYAGVSGHFTPQCEIKGIFSQYKNLYMHLSYLNEPLSVPWAFTSLFAIDKKIFDSSDGFDNQIRTIEDTLFGVKLTQTGHKLGFDKEIKVKHLHYYNFQSFIKTEFERSRNLFIHKLTNLFYRKKTEDKNIILNFTVSALIWPIIIGSLFFITIIPWLCFLLWLLFGLINFNFFRYLARRRNKMFALKSIPVFLLDISICDAGLAAGLWNFLIKKRV